MNDKIGSNETGSFFVNKSATPCKFCKDEKKVEELWDYCFKTL